jgi:uncharacterized protein YbjQ (UPF0145 family)
MIVTTGPGIEGYTISEYIGIVQGIVMREPKVESGFFGMKKDNFVRMCDQARRDAHARMVEHATELGADAVIGMHYDTSTFIMGQTEVVAYGTAIKLSEVAR